MTTAELIAHRSAHLTAYQNQALARRYHDRLQRLEVRLAGMGEAGVRLLRAAAISYARVLAYKDEYEVARLYSDPGFRRALEVGFAPGARIGLNLAPPFLPGKDAEGRPKKREFGPWIFPLLAVLARLKGLRGTWADPFARSHDRRRERELIALIEADLDMAETHASTATLPRLTELMALYQEIRGFGPVKEAAFQKQIQRRAGILAALQGHAPMNLAAE